MNKKKARQVALMVLFAMDVSNMPAKEAYDGIMSNMNQWYGEQNKEFVLKLIEEFLRHKDFIDKLITKYLKDWSFNRLFTIDKNILRLAITEIFFIKTKPPIVINEAIELAKTYSQEDSYKFINGILDEIVKHELTQW